MGNSSNRSLGKQQEIISSNTCFTIHYTASSPVPFICGWILFFFRIIFLVPYTSDSLFLFIYTWNLLLLATEKINTELTRTKLFFINLDLFCFLRFVVIFYFPAALDFCSRLIIGEMKLRFQPDGWDIRGGRHGHKQITLRQSAEAA